MVLKQTVRIVLLALVAIFGSSAFEASLASLSPLQSEDRIVSSMPPGQEMLVLDESMVWLDQAVMAPTRGIRFPAGNYILEAEDGDYRYYRAPTSIEYRVFKDGKVTGDREMPGGIYISKAAITLVPAGGYLSVDDTHKMLTWKLGLDFMHLENQKWHMEKR